MTLGQDSISCELNYINFTTKQGLPSNETYDVYQDSKGFMWISTDNGVAKFDGNSFENFTTFDGLTDNTIFKIYEDHLSRIWFLTYNRKLCYYEDGKFVKYPHNEELRKALQNFTLREVFTSLHIDEKETIHLSLLNMTEITISKMGLINVQINDQRVKNIVRLYKEKSLSSLHRSIKPNLNKIKPTKIILRTQNFGQAHLIPHDSITYIGTPQGLFLVNWENSRVIKSELSGYYVTGVEHDFEGGIWCSTLKNGILYIPNPAINRFRISNSKQRSLRTIIPQNDQLIFTTNSDTLEYLYLDTNNFSLKPYPFRLRGDKIPLNKIRNGFKFENPTFFEESHSPATSTISDNNGSIHFFCNNEIIQQYYLSDEQKQEINPSKLPESLSHKGLKWYVMENDSLTFKYLKSNPLLANKSNKYSTQLKIIKPIRLKSGEIYIATTNGIYSFAEENLKIKPIEKSFEFMRYRIQDIVEPFDNSCFFATKANGVFILKNDTVTQLTTKQGLLSNTINQLLYDSITQAIWAGTSNGLNKLVYANGKWNCKIILSQFDAINSQDIRSLYFYKNHLTFLSNKEMNIIPRGSLTPNNIKPRILLNSIKVNGATFKAEDLITLSYDSNNLNFKFNTIAYKSSKRISYEYQFLPSSTDWQKSQSGDFNFSGLPPGDYTLKVRSKNFFGVKSNLIVIPFSITPAFWMTWWFYTIIVGIGLIGVFYVSTKSIQIYKNQAKFQKSLKEMHVVSLQSKMNPHFIFNSLNSIQNYILKNEKMKANEYLLEFSTLIRAILQNSEHTSITLLKELETLRMYVELEKKRIRKEFVYIEKIDPKIDINLCIIPTLLIQPYIENSIWHGKVYTNPEGRIEVCICRNKGSLEFVISDNGIGIENAEKSKVRKKGYKSIGSETTKKRIQLLSELNNDITEVKISKNSLGNEEFPGTVITFSVPYMVQDHVPEEF